MTDFDIQSLISEVSAESPCGEDLSYDQSYLALEDMVRTRPAGGGVLGEEQAQEEPNWRQVAEKSFELLQRSKDLRIGIYFTLANLKLLGITGLRDGLLLIRKMLEDYWDSVYPQLDPDDNNDPLERINILQSLSPASVSDQDPMKFKHRLMEVPLCNSARMGKFSLRDIQVAKGEITVSAEDGANAPEISVIDAAFQDTTTDELLATSETTQEAIEHIAAIISVFSERASDGQTPDVSGFRAALGNIHKCVQEYLAKRGHGEAADEGAGDAGADPEKGGVSLTGEIRSTKEVLLALEKVCRYFDRHEPSSPIPLLLRRAQRLVSKNFLEVIQDVCPDALNQIEMISGISGGDSDSDQMDD
jgi:type VI secretion system protein ImpA